MGRLRASPIVLVLAAAALGLIACGGGEDADLLPGETASEISANLDQVEQLADEGDCLGASDAAQAVSLQVEELGNVDAELKRALREGAARLNEVVAGCEAATTEEEPVEAIEEAEEPEEEERKEKPDKPEKAEKEPKEPAEGAAEPSLPPQAEGKAKGQEKPEEEAPPPESGGTSAGGVAPGAPVEGE